MGDVTKINQLTQTQRDAALHAAKLRLIGDEPVPGPEPKLDDFLKRGAGKFPPGVLTAITVLAVVMLVAAFLPSAMRLHEVGRRTFVAAAMDPASVAWAAAATVVMAEIGQVIFSLAAAILGGGLWGRAALWTGAIICTLIALSGNAEIAKPIWGDTLFKWLETFGPPILVLIASNVLKSNALHAIEDRHAARQLHEDAYAQWVQDADARMDAWRRAYAHAEQDGRWMHCAVNALRDALVDANKVARKSVRELTAQDWRWLVHREMAAEQWYEQAAIEHQKAEVHQTRATVHSNGHHPVRVSAGGGGNRTGETAGQVSLRADGVWESICPHCERRFEKPDYEGASKSLNAHLRFCEVRNAEDGA